MGLSLLEHRNETEALESHRGRRAAPWLLPVLAALLLTVWLVWSGAERATPPAELTVQQLAATITGGDAQAVDRAAAHVADCPEDASPLLAALLNHETWRGRAAACELIARTGDEAWLPALLPRASDTDWRVRAAAFEALHAFHPLAHGSLPMQDTPLDAREETFLAWLADRDKAAASPLAPDLCELFAGTAFVEFGRPLAAKCLTCHAGNEPAPFEAGDACRDCHGDIHAQWSRSAHAQSLSHLRLATVDPQTRQSRLMSFGDVRGIGCTECHRPASAAVPASAASAAAPDRCPYTFELRGEPSAPCARCHASVDAQWRTWLDGAQPRPADWPPGQIDIAHRGDTRTCIDCHMPPTGEDDGPQRREHRWAARRDVPLLRHGIAVQPVLVRNDQGKPEVRITLVNLSGHSYPTGTRRRGVRLYAGPASGGGDPPALCTLSPAQPGLPRDGLEPALAPGEQRTVTVASGGGAEKIVYRVRYFRDLLNPEAYSVEILSGTVDLSGWPGL